MDGEREAENPPAGETYHSRTETMEPAFRLVRRLRLSLLEVWLGCGWLIGLSLLEVAGRRFTSDVADAAALLGVCLLMYLTWLVHRRRNLRAVIAIATGLRLVAHAIRQLRTEIGIDLARSTALPRGMPRVWCLLMGILTLLAAGQMIAAPAFPGGARSKLVAHCYLACLVLEGVLWSILAFGLLVYSALAWARLHDWLVERHRRQKPRSIRTEVRSTLAMFVILIGSAALLPIGIPFAVHFLFLAAACAALIASRPGLDFLWRSRSVGSVHALDARWVYWMTSAGSSLVSMTLILTAGGESLWDRPSFSRPTAAPVTLLIGRTFAWISVAGNFVALFYAVLYAALGRMCDRGGPAGDRGPTRPPEDRRAEIQSRREIIRRLRTLFRRAARQRGRRGTGLWIGLQHWFFLGLSRDDEGDEEFDRDTKVLDEIVGPPFHRVFTSRARRHYRRITEALRIDLIFVENGIAFPRFVRVLRMMFEIYDVHGGRMRAEERHFTGLPGVRVMFHDFDLCDAPWHGRNGYPEPDYELIGRARILYVFKDRGESDERVPVPESWEGLPAGTAV